MGCVVVFTQQSLSDMGICAAIFLVAAIYYLVYLRPRRATHWVMLDPASGDEAELIGTEAEPQVSTGGSL